VVSTSYSSGGSGRARRACALPEGYTAAPTVKSPDEKSRLRNQRAGRCAARRLVNLALEADGMPLGRARLQLFRPATIRLVEAMQLSLRPRKPS